MSTNFRTPLKREKFPMSIAGDFGVFSTDADSPVFYINTSFDIDSIGYLSPVREILDISEIDFEELVQRDLDDFRIRRDIAPYLTDNNGYKFFPPIVVAVTQPEENKKAIRRFYPNIRTRLIDDNQRFELEFEDSFCVRWFIDEEGKIISIPTEIRWKLDSTHLMAVDGQHRLVSLQAIRGLLKNSNLKRFYQNTSKDKNKLNGLKVPVTILFFPNSTEAIEEDSLMEIRKRFPTVNWSPENKVDVKEILRNIFVDVNKSAKQPSKSRTILLDEKDLTAVFTRKIFSAIKEEVPFIYTAILEYNSPNGKEVQIEKNRSVITTIGMVYKICEYLYKDNEGKEIDEGSNFRTRLGIDEEKEFPSSEEFPLHQVKALDFSLEQRKKAVLLFEEKWLCSFTKLYTQLTPFQRMINLVQGEYLNFQKKNKKDDFSIIEDTAYRTLFGGSEERFVLENLSKKIENSDARNSLKLLKEKEGLIRQKVRHFDVFYTLMFQKGFFEAITELITQGIFQSDHFAKEKELQLVIEQLNKYIEDAEEGFFLFDAQNYLYSLLIKKARPDLSGIVKNILVLILLNYKKNDNSIIGEIQKKDIEEISTKQLEEIKTKITTNLKKEFNSATENKVTMAEIKDLENKGKTLDADNKRDQLNSVRSAFVLERFTSSFKDLKDSVGVEF